MSPRPGGPDGPEDVDAAFAEIVADLEREGLGANLTDDATDITEITTITEALAAEPPPEPEPSDQTATDWRTADVDWDWASASEEEHYVPPDPPPLPRLRASTIFGLVLMLIGIFLLAAPALIGLAARIATPLTLIRLGRWRPDPNPHENEHISR
jgi:hypothetical protein